MCLCSVWAEDWPQPERPRGGGAGGGGERGRGGRGGGAAGGVVPPPPPPPAPPHLPLLHPRPGRRHRVRLLHLGPHRAEHGQLLVQALLRPAAPISGDLSSFVPAQSKRSSI